MHGKVTNVQLKGVPLVVRYHPFLNRINKIIIDQLYPVHTEKEVTEKMIFKFYLYQLIFFFTIKTVTR